MNDNEYWLSIWRLAAVVAVVLAATISGCTANRQYQTRMLIETAKVDPIAAKCAIEGEIALTAICILKASK